jgi:hypothetical protein
MTAVEYLIKEFSDILGKLQTDSMQDLLLVDAVKKAKEMEKQQIIDACQSTSNTDFWVKYESFEHYYNEKFKQ